MTSGVLKLYHHLPAPAKSLAASLRGLQLRRWRYGPETQGLVEQARERESWTNREWAVWQQERLAEVLHRAATRVPFYREAWAARRRKGDRSSWEQLENWPLLEKESVRKNPGAFVADDCDTRTMYHDHTSGTTGTQLDLWLKRETVRTWYALFEMRSRRWYGVSESDRWAMLGGQLVIPVGQRKPPFWVWNAGLKQLYMSSYHLSLENISHYLDALKHYGIKYLLGYSSSLYELAEGALRLGRKDITMAVAITNAEPLFEYQRKAIEQAFQCRVRETYGMAETVAAASECEAGRMHVWPEVGVIEVLKDSQTPTGHAGELVCTSLMNGDMPLIRYRVGDRGAVANGATCSCNRTLPILSQIEGRIDDTLYTRDGRKIGRLDPVFKSDFPIREAQIIQETLERIRVRYVPADTWTPEVAPALIDQLRSRMGDIRVDLEQVNEVPRGANGKFRAVVCNLPPRQLEALKMSKESQGTRMQRVREHRRETEANRALEVVIRVLRKNDLDAMTAIHLAASPKSPISLLGSGAVKRFFEWQMIGPHSASAYGAFIGEMCVGFCFGGIFRGAMSGFVSHNRLYLIGKLLARPWLLSNQSLREHLRLARSEMQIESQTESPPINPSRPQTFGILALAVSQPFQRQGIGRLLMQHIEEIAHKHSFHEMQLTVDPDDERAITICQRLGWEKVVAQGEWRGEMKKALR
ncbi:MAG TPA: GNAT family N-acetyltransferase [Pyrinomonadaceae bacterium]